MLNFKTLACKVPKLCYASKSMQCKNAQSYKGPKLMKYFSEFIQKLIKSSTYHYQSIH